MKQIAFLFLALLTTLSVSAQFLVPEFDRPVKVRDLSNESEETTPILFNQSTEILYHRIYLNDNGDEVEAEGKDIWYSKVDEKKTAKLSDTATLKKAWEAPYRFFKDGEVDGLNAVFGMSEDGVRIYMINTTFTKDTFEQKLVYLEREVKNEKVKGWKKELVDIEIPGLVLDGRNADISINQEEDIILVSVGSSLRSLNQDLFVSLKQKNGSWGKLINLGNTVNTNRTEITPFLSKDKKRLYFSSNGHPGFGDVDVFVSTRLDDSWKKWSRPLNLGEPINSKDADEFFVISGKDEAYLVSDRDPNSDYFDIYYAHATGKFIVPNIDSVKGNFYFNQLPVANVEMEVYDIDGNLIDIIVTDQDGKFNFVKLSADEDYVIQLADANDTELIGGMLYFLDEEGEKKKRYVMTESGVFKSAEKIDKKELIQGMYVYNKEPKAAFPIVIEDVNSFPIDTVLTDEKGKFEYQKLVYDDVFTMYPQDVTDIDVSMADLYLTDENGERTRTFTLIHQETGKGTLMLNSLPIANSVVKVYDVNGNLIETILTNEDGSFSYKKLSMTEDMVLEVEAEDNVDLVGGIVYLTNEKQQQKRYFIQKGNSLVEPGALGKETVYGKFNYKKLPAGGVALEVIDQNGMPIDTIYTDENGFFSYEKMNLDKNYSIQPLDASDYEIDDLNLFLTDKNGNKTQDAVSSKDGGFSFASTAAKAQLSTEKKKAEEALKPLKQSSPNVIHFDFASRAIVGKELSKLKNIASKVKNSNGLVQLIGHTDAVDTEKVNQRVGLERAQAVKDALVRMGVKAEQIELSSKGELSPVASNKTAAGRAENRRVEIKMP
ncbi:MAG: OmpA family protein [Vicingaceae bacterium]